MMRSASVSMYDRSYARVDRQLRNVHYDNDIHYTLQMCEWLLKLVGVWPLVNSHTRSKLQQLLSTVLISTWFSSIFFIILPSFYHIFFVEKNTDMKVKLIGPFSFCFASVIKYSYLGTKGHFFERCMQHVRKDWKTVRDPNYRTIMLKYATVSRKLITVCAAFLYSGVLLFHTVMQFLSKEKSGENNTFRPLAYPGYDSFLDTQSSPTYEIMFSFHCFTGMIMCSITMLAYSMAATFVTHICGQIQIQIARLHDLVKRKQRRDVGPDPLSVIVHDHAEILRFSRNVEEALREVFLAQIVEATMNMCLLEYYCIMAWRNNDVVTIMTCATLLVSFTFNIFIFCYVGEILSEQCRQIGEYCYKIGWYNLPAKDAYDLIPLVSISQYPPKLTAGKIIELSLDTFSSVTKTSLVYLNLLQTLTDW